MGGPWVVNDPSSSWASFICLPLTLPLLLHPLKRPAAVFAVDPGVRWKTYTHKQHLLFMPYSPRDPLTARTGYNSCPATPVADRQVGSV